MILIIIFGCLLIEKVSGEMNHSLHHALKVGIMNETELETLVNSTSNADLKVEDNNGMTPIFLAASLGNVRLFKLIQARGGEGNITNREGETLLHRAVMGGDLQIIDIVLEVYEISLSAQDKDGNTVMHYVALGKPKRNKIEICRMLLEEGAIYFIKNNENKTPYHIAVLSEDKEILEIMLQMKAQGIQIHDENGHTPMQIALDRKFTNIFSLLINYSVSPFEKDFNGRTVIHNAILNGEIELIKTALLSGNVFRGEANRIITYQEGLGYQDLLNYTALHSAAEKGFEEVIKIILKFKKCIEPRCKDLIVKTTNYYDDTILHGAVKGGKVSILEQLLDIFEEMDSYIDQQNKDGHTPLHIAVQDEKPEMVNLLLIKKANAFIKDFHDFYPLSLAASFSKLNMLRLFKQYKYNAEPNYTRTELLGLAIANVNDQDVIEELLNDTLSDFGQTFLAPAKPLDGLIQNHCNSICTITLEKCERNSPEQKKVLGIIDTITGDHEKFIRELAEEDEDESSDLFGSKPTMLNYALFFNGKLSTVKKILECKSATGNKTICEACRINDAWSPIDIAAFRGKLDIVDFFIEECKKQCNISLVEMKDKHEQTVIHKAAWGGQCKIIEYLKRNQSANINDIDKWKRTPLHVAALRGYKGAIECILNLDRTSLNWRDKYGFNSLHLAEIYGHHKFFTVLQQTSLTLDSQVRYQMKYPGTKSRIRNHADVIDLLLQNGLNPNLQDGTLGWSPLHWAAANGDLEVVKMLVNNKIKANVNLPSKSDQTPMYLARFWGRKDVYNYLKSLNAVW